VEPTAVDDAGLDGDGVGLGVGVGFGVGLDDGEGDDACAGAAARGGAFVELPFQDSATEPPAGILRESTPVLA
jgi:hypothetical protein